MSSSGRHSSNTLFLALTIVATLVAPALSQNNSTKLNHGHTAAVTLLKSSCSATFYPELCFSAVSALPAQAVSEIKSPKDVIELSLNLTITAVQSNSLVIKRLINTRKGLTVREKTALRDCLETVDETLYELHKTGNELQGYPKFNNKSISEQADDLKILLSAAITNQETCLDGFSHDRADRKVRQVLMKGQKHAVRMCSNALAMIKNLTDSDMASEAYSSGRHLKEEKETEWPEWLSAGDRRLLQATTLTPDVTVAADGSGDYLTVAEAVAAAPARSSERYIIRIKAGVYRENVEVTSQKTNIMFVGDSRLNTIITGNRNVVDGSTTFRSATVAAVGEGFLAREITFENSAGPSKHQAVALRVGSDRSAFYRCDMIAYQDTLYVHSLRQFFVSCYIAGTVDFIFGNAAVVFQNCDIHARRPNPGQRNMVTAQGRDDANENTGIVIQKCRIGATKDLIAASSSFQTYLGRPWKLHSRTVIMQSDISDVIHPAGWFEWSGDFALNTLFYREYANTGPGADTSNRVNWIGFGVFTSAAEAQPFTAENFIAGSSWLGSTGFPFSLGL